MKGTEIFRVFDDFKSSKGNNNSITEDANTAFIVIFILALKNWDLQNAKTINGKIEWNLLLDEETDLCLQIRDWDLEEWVSSSQTFEQITK